MSTLLVSQKILRAPPIAMALIAIAILCLMDGVLKDMTSRYSSLQVTFLRFAPSAIFGAALFVLSRTPRPDRRSIVGNLQRGLLFLAASAMFIHAMGKAPLTEVFAISYMAPILAALAAMPILGERPDGRVALSLLIGFAGVIVAIGGVDLSSAHAGQIEGAIAALGSAVAYAFVIVFLRRQALRDSPITIALFQSLTPAILLGLLFLLAPLIAPSSPIANVWKPVLMSDWPGILFIGLCSILGHLAMARAYAGAEASRLAPLEYSSFVWAALIGFVGFAEIPSAATLVGAAMIIGACFLLRRPAG